MKKDQIANASSAASEILKSTTFVQDFGPHAPSQTTLGFLMANADSWRTTWEGASQFAAYAAEQRAAWEAAAQAEMATFQPAFELATTTEPAVAKKYTATAKYLGARSAISKRAASTRKAQVAAKAKKADATTPPPTPATEPLVTPTKPTLN
jgi:hypothetical protein